MNLFNVLSGLPQSYQFLKMTVLGESVRTTTKPLTKRPQFRIHSASGIFQREMEKRLDKRLNNCKFC